MGGEMDEDSDYAPDKVTLPSNFKTWARVTEAGTLCRASGHGEVGLGITGAFHTLWRFLNWRNGIPTDSSFHTLSDPLLVWSPEQVQLPRLTGLPYFIGLWEPVSPPRADKLVPRSII